MKKPRKDIVVPIITALITATATILVSFIGILPQLRQQDLERIKNLESQVDDTLERMSISGKAYFQEGSSQPLSNVEVYLVIASGNELVTTTDDKGEFMFDEIPKRNWWIIVRNLNSNVKPSGRFLLGQHESGELRIDGAYITYGLR